MLNPCFKKKFLILDKLKLFALLISLIVLTVKIYLNSQLEDVDKISFSLRPLTNFHF
ncbi:hypothetical protein BBUWI9123_I0034 (plasmid) [Borreliella burgdorferi WI91-23]|nr:hypothetical protein BBUWI9123_I0034 [Borreliella burgdorferi WI91-23]